MLLMGVLRQNQKFGSTVREPWKKVKGHDSVLFVVAVKLRGAKVIYGSCCVI